ncbi:MAG: hypothetical protein GWM89_11935 [Candidatus Dadabacteria bacterium]|nr:hypothetical protein [Candidatus Dadabacteria bacterium]NIY23100.1 hypothetical protein [Candidatus Dadabacteria bacterium]
MYKKSNLLSIRNVSAVFLFLGMFALCTLTFGVIDANAGTPGSVIIRYKGDCDVSDIQFDNIEVNKSGRANVVIRPNGEAVGKCSLRVDDEQLPKEKLTVQSFACELRDADGNKYSAFSKATLNTGGMLDITCTAKIDTDTNGTDAEKGNKSKKENGTTSNTGKGKGKK